MWGEGVQPHHLCNNHYWGLQHCTTTRADVTRTNVPILQWEKQVGQPTLCKDRGKEFTNNSSKHTTTLAPGQALPQYFSEGSNLSPQVPTIVVTAPGYKSDSPRATRCCWGGEERQLTLPAWLRAQGECRDISVRQVMELIRAAGCSRTKARRRTPLYRSRN